MKTVAEQLRDMAKDLRKQASALQEKNLEKTAKVITAIRGLRHFEKILKGD